MGLMTAGVFLVNILCALIPCDPVLNLPEVKVRNHVARQSNSLAINFDPVVRTDSGNLEGYTMFSTEGRTIYAFESIPYAEPPINDLRFRSPVPKTPWIGVRKAQKKARDCLQLSPPKLFRVVGHEDCLYLNVFTRKLPDYSRQENLLPVIFYIHGGSYYFGNGADYGPAYLLNHDIVLVTVNYRLGVLGFMSSGDSASPGNYGLKDQWLALKWVSQNVQNFGGNPKNITIFGQSSGGASAHFHLMSKQSSPIFQSGVSLSSSGLTHWAYKSHGEAKRLTNQLAKMNKCPIDNRYAMVDCLRKSNPVSLVSSQFRMLDWLPFPIVLFAPVIESPQNPDAFLTVSPQEFYARGNKTRDQLKPWIFGMTSEEGYLGILFLKLLYGENSLRQKWSELGPAFLDFKHTAKDPAGLANELASLYFGYYSPKNVPNSYIAQLFGDRLFLHGVFRAISLHSGMAPTYAYLFQFKGKYNAGNVYGYQSFEWGVGHTEDLYYYFNSSQFYPGFKRSDKEYQLSHVLTTLITNFAGKGEPLMSTDGRSYPVWDTFNVKNPQFLRIDWNIQMIPQPMLERFNLWDNFSPQMKKDLNLL